MKRNRAPSNDLDRTTELLSALPNLRVFYRRVAALLSSDESDYHLRTLVEAVRVCEDCRGSATPAENFISNLLRGQALTPENVQGYFTEFRTEFNFMVEESRNFIARYPKVAMPACAGNAGETRSALQAEE